MRLRFPLLLAPVCLLASGCATGPVGVEDDLRETAMQTRFASALQGPLEQVLGEPFGEPVLIKPGTREEIARVIAQENVLLLEGIVGGQRGKALEVACDTEAWGLAPYQLGKTSLLQEAIYINREAFEAISETSPELAEVDSKPFLDLVLLHEAIHVFQKRKFPMASFFGRPRTREELLIRMAIVEGHAQFMTRKVAHALGLERHFELLLRVNCTNFPPSKDPGQRAFQEVVERTGFQYLDGEQLFTRLAEEVGPEQALIRLLNAPPESLREVTYPNEYLDPPRDWAETGRLAWRVGALLGKRFSVRVNEVGEKHVRKRSLLAGAGTLLDVLRGYRGGASVVGVYQPDGEAAVVAEVRMVAFNSPDAVRAFLAMERKLDAQREKRDYGTRSLIVMEGQTYEQREGHGLSDVTIDKEVRLHDTKGPHLKRSLLFRRGRFAVEVQLTRVPHSEDKIVRLARKIRNLLPEFRERGSVAVPASLPEEEGR